MLIVTGSLTATPETFDRFLEKAVAHTRRSRTEDGCLHHEVARDCEDPMRLVFFEKWRDRAALEAHFRDPAAIAFVSDIRRSAAASQGPDIHVVAD